MTCSCLYHKYAGLRRVCNPIRQSFAADTMLVVLASANATGCVSIVSGWNDRLIDCKRFSFWRAMKLHTNYNWIRWRKHFARMCVAVWLGDSIGWIVSDRMRDQLEIKFSMELVMNGVGVIVASATIERVKVFVRNGSQSVALFSNTQCALAQWLGQELIDT